MLSKLRYSCQMRNIFGSIRVRDTLLALESAATGAGYAMACPFGSSGEFEAAIIQRKIEFGVYGYKRRWRYVSQPRRRAPSLPLCSVRPDA